MNNLIMESQTIMLGNVNLERYVSRPKELSEERKGGLQRLLGRLERSELLENERLPLQLLQVEREQYAQLDPSFLAMSNAINYRGKEIKVPKFSVYYYNNKLNGFDRFSLTVSVIHIPFLHFGKVEFGSELPDIMRKPLFRSTDFYQGKDEHHRVWNRIPKDVKRKYHPYLKTELSSGFNGLIPPETKSKIKTANKIFDKEVCLIAETMPEEWNVQTVKTDPLVVGVLNGENCYLIDHFNTTSVEDYVRKEFSS